MLLGYTKLQIAFKNQIGQQISPSPWKKENCTENKFSIVKKIKIYQSVEITLYGL